MAERRQHNAGYRRDQHNQQSPAAGSLAYFCTRGAIRALTWTHTHTHTVRKENNTTECTQTNTQSGADLYWVGRHGPIPLVSLCCWLHVDDSVLV